MRFLGYITIIALHVFLFEYLSISDVRKKEEKIMSKIKATKPSFVVNYWKPWEENSNLFDSYLNYTKDISLLKYGADSIGKYINHASKEQVLAINQLGKAIGRGMDVLFNQMSDINESLVFLNRNLDVQIEQQKLSNLLLNNIAELLRVPDSEKERQHCIELGVKFFVNASKDSDLYVDALEELLKAEAFLKQDYFVLHRIGIIYLYVEKFINPEKALEYFIRAAKYASVESDQNAARLANVLINNLDTVNSSINSSEKEIGLLAADSFQKAAFSAYILSRFSDAVTYQSKALKFHETPQNRFLLAKYQIRNGDISDGIINLSKSIDDEPILAVATFKEIDLINEPEVLKLISKKNDNIDEKICKLIREWKIIESDKALNVIKDLNKLALSSYEIKVSKFKIFTKETKDINIELANTEATIDNFIFETYKMTFCTLDSKSVEELIEKLKRAKDFPLEQMKETFLSIKKIIKEDELKLGSMYAGGIVFFLDETGKHGLVCASKDFGKGIWSDRLGEINTLEDVVSNGAGMRNTRKIVMHEGSATMIHKMKRILESIFVKNYFFSQESIKAMPTASKLCIESKHKGFTDWYLPTISELELMYETLKKKNLGNFHSAEYWSSVEFRYGGASFFDFRSGYDGADQKSTAKYVRAVRAF